MISRATRTLAGALAALALTTSCYGPFNATQHLHKWNGEISENKWVVEGLFLVAVLIPVYLAFIIADGIVFNSIEFWGWDNPISEPGRGTAALDDGAARTLRVENVAAHDRGLLKASIVAGGVVEEELCVDTDAEGVTTLTRSTGTFVASFETLGSGDIVVRDALGFEIARGAMR